MGYDRRAQAGPLWLAFEAEELAGLEVWFNRPGVDALAACVDLDDFEPVTGITGVEVVRCRPLVHHFAESLIKWTLEENGVPVPASAKAFLGLDALFQMQVAKTWARVMVRLPQLPEVVAEPSIEASLPMEQLAS